MASIAPLTDQESNEFIRLRDEGRKDRSVQLYVVRFMLNGYNVNLSSGYVTDKRINVINMIHYFDVPKSAIDYILSIRPELNAVTEKTFMPRMYKHNSRPLCIRENKEDEAMIWMTKPESNRIHGEIMGKTVEEVIRVFNSVNDDPVHIEEFVECPYQGLGSVNPQS